MEYMDFGLDEFQQKAAELYKKFEALNRKTRNELAEKVITEAAQIFLAEQKRLLAASPNPEYCKFADWLSVWTYKNKNGWRVEVGYTTEVIKDHIEVLITEFGRPGARGLKKGGKDTLGRKIGKVEPYSHIRASMFLKKEEVMAEVQRRWEEEILKAWNGT